MSASLLVLWVFMATRVFSLPPSIHCSKSILALPRTSLEQARRSINTVRKVNSLTVLSTRTIRRIEEQAFSTLKTHVPSIVRQGEPEGKRVEYPSGTPVIFACVSGGSDSMAMLDILSSICKRVNVLFDLRVVHFDHQLRGKESDQDRDFVVDACKTVYGISSSKVHMRFWGTTSNPPHSSESIQEKARLWRSFELEKLVNLTRSTTNSERIPEVFVAMAHHADDSVETILMKLLRGTSICSIKGIDPLVKQNGVMKIRPLLRISKADLRSYLIEKGLDWREDSSNKKNVYQRNKIRNLLIPLLGEIAGSPKALADRFSELDQQVRFLGAFVDEELQAGETTQASIFIVQKEAPVFLERERLHRFLKTKKNGNAVCYKAVEEVWQKLSSTHEKLVELGDSKYARVKSWKVEVTEKNTDEKQ
eukprot:jgi/Bigna1/127517/aug1.4_g2225